MDAIDTLPRRISLDPSKIEQVRRATRVIAMVHELHKAGYQRIRIHPGISPSGAHWRCNVTYSSNVESDGFSIRVFDLEDGHVAPYTSADGALYFGWKDGASLNARQMAQRFLQTFPFIAERGIGRDWPYAGWLTDVLGRAEQGRREGLVTLYANYPLEREIIAVWQPPAPSFTSN
jgi:hypothetical protein